MTDRSALRGFTLIELMVVVAVLAIVATVAVPSFRQVIENNRLATESNRLFSAMSFARSEAVRVGDDVSLSARTGGFDAGWCVHLGADCSGTDILRQFDAGNQLDYTASASTLTFNARGEMTNAAFQVSLEPVGCETGETDKMRTVTVSLSGRASIQAGDCT
ncbi:pilus assembly protein [Marinobacter vulgaris]|uniref:Type II secretion system protein H n=1 Tax=Marinobacter vulgaris TaxID=1928331 RepID=A0A2V3ZGC8_9GAMM|nr:GspH/FimT family pseudopilin [Marinobacter vulgaris]PXX89401.1 pilus assembly protein [Marinobacter vulgaris]TSJ68060.1 prepilin-type N-terminal cleavage/methylation domain-containing protein [Marinobacter vulgaris]